MVNTVKARFSQTADYIRNHPLVQSLASHPIFPKIKKAFESFCCEAIVVAKLAQKKIVIGANELRNIESRTVEAVSKRFFPKREVDISEEPDKVERDVTVEHTPPPAEPHSKQQEESVDNKEKVGGQSFETSSEISEEEDNQTDLENLPPNLDENTEPVIQETQETKDQVVTTFEEFISEVESFYGLRQEFVCRDGNSLFTSFSRLLMKQMPSVSQYLTPPKIRKHIVKHMATYLNSRSGKENDQVYFELIQSHLKSDISLLQLLESQDQFKDEFNRYPSDSNLYMRLNELFENRNEESFNRAVEFYLNSQGIADYLSAMSLEKVYGGYVELMAFCEIYGLSARIFSPTFTQQDQGYIDLYEDTGYYKQRFIHLILFEDKTFDLLNEAD